MRDASEVRRQFHSSRRVVTIVLLASFLAFASVGRSDGRVQGSRNAPAVGRQVAPGLTYRSIVRKKPHQRIKILTVDPSFQYVLANGGGSQNFAETDAQLRGNSSALGVDLNGDGDLADTVSLYRPNNTNTRRYGVTSSLIWKFSIARRVWMP